ncbi:MAG: hypothetical protein M3N51_02025 [Actinomycetota bacterium]|nr:hypothetical protein [Actinomycetota bacterium]
MKATENFQERRSPLAGLPAGSPMLSAPQPWGLTVVTGGVPKTAGTEAILPLGPERWLVVHEEQAEAPPSVIETDERQASTVDVGHGITRIRVSGIHSRALLGSGISIDLHPQAFPAGESAATAYRDVFVVVHNKGDDTYDLYTPRSYAASLWEWLGDAEQGIG